LCACVCSDMQKEIEASIKTVDGLIEKVSALKVPAAGKGKRSAAGGAQDVAWLPECPPGHTPYSWYGEEEEEEGTGAPSADAKRGKGDAKGDAKAAGKKSKKDKKKQKGQQKKGGKKAKPANDAPLFARVDLRVGVVRKVWEHPDPEVKALWCEEIDVGEDKPRQVVSGLRAFYKKEDFEGKRIIVVCNLKPSKMRGFVSHGMVLCASNADHTKVELIKVPDGSKPGTRISLSNLDVNEFTPDGQINARKKKSIWLEWQPKLKTNDSRVAIFDGVALVTPEGECVAPTLADCIIK